ncbi:hypothetical protein M9Y10_006262 [Tritrichomonas musculus]|uniref:Uncharacterized protein n=1 Tax=Tritrichomonas musculus TaxID=1915356 RepID=A0ABR2JDP7_9EUKA
MDQNNKYMVESSSFLNPGCLVKHLFNGKKESEGGLRWISKTSKEASIQVTFPHPLRVNLISMTSRNEYWTEGPSDFGILGLNESGNLTKLRSFHNIYWTQNENQLFAFDNTKKFSSYKLIFTRSCYGESEYLYGMSELNLGEFNLDK